MFFVRMSDGKRFSAYEAITLCNKNEAPFDSLGLITLEQMINNWQHYTKDLASPADYPFHALRVFAQFTERGFFPPEPIIKWVNDAFSGTIKESTVLHRRTIDERLGVQGTKLAKKQLYEFRDMSFSRDFHILTTHFGFSNQEAGDKIINKYSEGGGFPGFMVSMWRDIAGVPQDSKRIEQIYKEYKKKHPEQFKKNRPTYSGFPDFYNDEIFLATFEDRTWKAFLLKKTNNKS